MESFPCNRFHLPIRNKVLYKNESEKYIELPGTKQRIKAKTAWNADSLRGDYADELILDEFQLMNEDIWDLVGAPMLLDNNGNAVFIYTPPSLHSRSVSKANNKMHAAKFFRLFQEKEKPIQSVIEHSISPLTKIHISAKKHWLKYPKT